MPEMILKLASSNWPSKGQAKAEDKYRILAATKLWCIFNFFLSTLFKKQIFFDLSWAFLSPDLHFSMLCLLSASK